MCMSCGCSEDAQSTLTVPGRDGEHSVTPANVTDCTDSEYSLARWSPDLLLLPRRARKARPTTK
jgi:hypothetical protein